jgi:hypothetical protein
MARFELVIENEQALSFLELKEIISIVDGYVIDHVTPLYFDDYLHFGRWDVRGRRINAVEAPEISFLEIESVRPGSIILTVLGGAAAFGLGAIAVGVRRSRLGAELTRFGENVGEILGEGVSRINDALEDWSDKNLKLRDRKTKASFRQIAGETPVQPRPRRRG